MANQNFKVKNALDVIGTGVSSFNGPVTHFGQVTSTVQTGIAPFVVSSSTVVSNLNADRVDGKDIGTVSSGGVVYASSTSNIRSTAAGTTGQVLTSNGSSSPSWTNQSSLVVGSAGTLTTPRTINGTAFDGSDNITTSSWGISRTVTVGNTSKSVNGSAAVSWSLSEIGAEPEIGYATVNKAGDIMTGFLTLHDHPTHSLHATTKGYVDSVAEGILAKPAAKAATTHSLVGTYNNGTAGVGATLNLGPLSIFEIDGVNNWTMYDGVLIKNQTNPSENGRYYVSQVGSATTNWILTRCRLCDEAKEIPGAYVFVYDGLVNKGTGWVQVVDAPSTFVVGVNNINIYQFSGDAAYTAGPGLTLTGSSFSLTSGIVSPGTYTKVTVDTYGRTTAGTTLIASDIPNLDANKITTGILSNTRTTGVEVNTANTLVLRDSSGNFSAGTITATLNGNATNVTGTVAVANGGTGATTAGAAVTNLGATTVGANLFGLTNPSAVRFIQINADNTISALDAATFLSAIGGASGSGTVTSVALSGGTTGLTVTGSPITTSGTITLAGTLALANGGTGATTAAAAVTNLGLGAASNVQFNSLGVGTAASGVAGEIRATNNITAFFSDNRLKDVTGKIKNALDKVKTLNGVYYTLNDIAEKYGYTNKEEQVGVIAQEVQAVLPHVVTAAPFDIAKAEDGAEYSKSGENYLTVRYERLVPLLIEAIKEQQTVIDSQEERISRLEEMLNSVVNNTRN